MRSVAFPIRVGVDGRLERADPERAVMELIRVMVSIRAEDPFPDGPEGRRRKTSFWDDAPWFKLQEELERANPDIAIQKSLRDALNRALGGSGMKIDWASVTEVRAKKRRRGDPPVFSISLSINGGRPTHQAI